MAEWKSSHQILKERWIEKRKSLESVKAGDWFIWTNPDTRIRYKCQRDESPITKLYDGKFDNTPYETWGITSKSEPKYTSVGGITVFLRDCETI